MCSSEDHVLENKNLAKPCLHQEKKCVQCEQVFTTADNRHALYSGTYYGTYTKSVDQDNESSGAGESSGTGESSGLSKWVIPGQQTHLVKYSVNGVFKGQTRFSYSFDEGDKCYTKRLVKKQPTVDGNFLKEEKKVEEKKEDEKTCLDKQNIKQHQTTNTIGNDVKSSSEKLTSILKQKKVSFLTRPLINISVCRCL